MLHMISSSFRISSIGIDFALGTHFLNRCLISVAEFFWKTRLCYLNKPASGLSCQKASSFLIPYSSFLIPHSSFLIPHSASTFLIQYTKITPLRWWQNTELFAPTLFHGRNNMMSGFLYSVTSPCSCSTVGTKHFLWTTKLIWKVHSSFLIPNTVQAEEIEANTIERKWI